MVSTCGSGPVGRCCSASISFTRAYSLRLIGVPSPPAIASSFPLNKTWLHVRSNFIGQIFEFHFDCGGSRTPFARKMRRLLARRSWRMIRAARGDNVWSCWLSGQLVLPRR
jgi:hypothetical protein